MDATKPRRAVAEPEPAPVVDGDLPVIDEMNSMNSSGRSMKWSGA